MIRPATIQDLEQLVEIYNQAIAAGNQTAHTEPVDIESRWEWFYGHTAEGQLLLVYLKNDSVLGYLTLSAHRPGREAFGHTREVSIYIHPSSIGQGIGAGLLKHTLSLCPSMEIDTLIAIILANNQASISFFKHHHFSEWGRLPEAAMINGKRVDHVYLGLKV